MENVKNNWKQVAIALHSVLEISGVNVTSEVAKQAILKACVDYEVMLKVKEPPTKEWRCFHCDEVFSDKQKAREHFGDMGFENGKVTWENVQCNSGVHQGRLMYPHDIEILLERLGAEFPFEMEYLDSATGNQCETIMRENMANYKRFQTPSESEAERDQLRAEFERCKIELDLERRHLEHERQTVEFLRSGEEVLKSQVKELINQRNQLLPLQSEMTNLKETHIMQLAAISVAANSNTDSTIEEALKCHPDYKTVALSVVVVAIQREIWERNQKDQWRAVADKLAEELDFRFGQDPWRNPKSGAGMALAAYEKLKGQP